MERSTVHPVSCDICETVMYECDVISGAIYVSPEDEYDISDCPGCGEMLILEKYSRVEHIVQE